jgi:iron complex outermembrane receptor protein
MSESLPIDGDGRRIVILLVCAGITLALSLGVAIPAAAQTPPPRDLTQFTLEDLMNVQVISVSKKEQRLAKTGAAIFVITQEDIRRSGATNIPDLLRMVPGVDVARVDHSNWAVTIRGFNAVFSNKVLVLIDGRSVYHPVFSGVIWYALDVPLDDIERIEVIRGPGGTVWGANAMNGVINILTKSSKDTSGGLLTADGGSNARADALFQYGGKAGHSGGYRVYGQFSNQGNSDPATAAQPADQRRLAQGGFRSDWDLSPRDLLMVQGDYHRVDGGETLTGVVPQMPSAMGTYAQEIGDDGGNILGRWTHTFLNGSDISLEAYFDKSEAFANGAHDFASIGNFDFQHHLSLGSRHDLVWGLGYRAAANRFTGNGLIMIHPPQHTVSLYSGFLQDEITLARNLSLTLGAKFEHNAYTGYENEPSAQLAWSANSHNTIWASAAKAIRQPSDVDSGLESVASIVPLPQGALGVVTALGNPAIKAEELRDFETGYRGQINPRFSLDLAAFLSFYKNLETNEPQTPFFAFIPSPPHLVVPLLYENLAHARNYGVEAFANWNVTDRWRISPGVTMLNMSVRRNASSQDTTAEQLPGYSPRRSFQVRSFINLGRSFEWDQTIGYTGPLAIGNIPGYVRLDTRLGWRLGEFVEFSIVGQNLLQPRHAEFPDFQLIDHMQDQRGILGKVTWRF